MAHPRSPSLLRRNVLSALGAGLLLASTACAPKVQAQRVPGFDLEAVKSYAWITNELVLIEFGTTQPNIRTKDNEQRIRSAVDRELTSRGFSAVDRSEAELLVAFSVGVDMRYRLEGADGTALTPDGPGEQQTKGTLNIYLLDPQGQRQVWHGWISKWLSSNDDPEEVINMAVGKIMSAYPNEAP